MFFISPHALLVAALFQCIAFAAGGDVAAVKTLHSFCSVDGCKDGLMPFSGLTNDSSTLGLHCALKFLSSENCTDGAQSQGGTLDANGNLVGVTTHGGSDDNFADGVAVFRLHGKELTTLYSFCTKSNCNDGRNPVGGIALDDAGHVRGHPFRRR